MSLRTILVLVLAILCGTSAAVGVKFLVSRPKGAVPTVKTVPVVVASVEIPRGTQLKPGMFHMLEWPEKYLPAGALTDCNKVTDCVAVTAMVIGEPVLQSRISATGLGLPALIRPGMRAYTILTPSASSGVAGFVHPGNRVDVLLTVGGRGQASEADGTWTLLQNVEVLAADQRLDQADPKKGEQQLRSVTLLVTPDMATKLTLAQSMGTLQLTLRNDTDIAIARTNPVTMRDIRFLQEAVRGGEGGGLLASVGRKAVEFLKDTKLAQEEAKKAEQEKSAEVLVPAGASGNSTGIVCLRGTNMSVVRMEKRR
jgi:pilus assembly protein CpaB